MRKRAWPRWVRPWFRLENLHFLFEASSQLSVSLDLNETLAKVVQLLVPGLADWCVIDLAERNDRRLVVVHKDPIHNELIDRLQEYPIRLEQVEGIPKTIRTGEALLYDEISEEQLQKNAYNEEYYQILCALGCRSAIITPIQVHGERLGSLSFFISEPPKKYNQYDLTLFQEIANRVALSLYNAKLYQKEQETVAMREEFISIASHEIRTPLTNLSLQLQLAWLVLRKETTLTDGIRQATQRVEKAREQVDRIVTFIDELLEVSKLGMENWPIAYEPLDLCEVTRASAKQLEELQNKHQATLTLNMEKPVVGQWDRVRLEQIITNLLSNAFKYGQGNPVTLTIFQTGDLATVWVQDHGIGIEASEQEKIFKKFIRATKETSQHSSGLGLWLVRQMVEFLGGAISVHSQPNQGSRFEVVLPLIPKKR